MLEVNIELELPRLGLVHIATIDMDPWDEEPIQVLAVDVLLPCANVLEHRVGRNMACGVAF